MKKENNDMLSGDCGTQSPYIKMDYSLETPEERIQKINEIIANTPSEKLTPYYLTKMANYIIDSSMDKKERLQNKILTEEHMVTVNKRERSFEGLVERITGENKENCGDAIYDMIANDKNIIFAPKIGITKEDIKEIPGLKELIAEIEKIKELTKSATGMKSYLLHKQLREMREDQYELKSLYRKPIKFTNLKKSSTTLDLSETISIIDNEQVKSTGILNLFTPAHISLLLCNYSTLKEESWDVFTSDIHWMMEDLDNLIEITFADYPMYKDLIIYKIDGKSNLEIQNLLEIKHKTHHTVEYISALWKNKLPKMIAGTAVKEYLTWYFTFVERGKWKRCSRCGEIKLANNLFFSKNSTSKDGYYSICKSCRNDKTKKIKPKGE